MCAFLKSIDVHIWMSVEKGWKKPDQPMAEWIRIPLDEFRRISYVETTMEAWDILEFGISNL